MDLGIRGKWAVVCGASKGLGYGCARSLAGEGANVVINARSDAPLQEAARRIRDETGVEVIAVATDITKAPGREQVLAAARQVTWVWVKGHAGDPSNERVDALARAQALSRMSQGGHQLSPRKHFV